MPGGSRSGPDRLLRALLFLLAAAPALVFAWGARDGNVVVVLYREPKLVAVAILGWTFLSAFFWIRRERLVAGEAIQVLRQPAFLLLHAFVAYGAATGLWVTVYENLFYELSQYLLLVLLTFSLCLWARHDEDVRRWVQYGLIVSLAVATIVGILQMLVSIPVLTPIAPEAGVRNPSVMGYKNPMALSLLGQLYLLLGLSVAKGTGPRTRAALFALLGLELLYLVTLQSRTSYAALGASAAFFVALALVGAPFARTRRRIALGSALVALVIASGFTLHAPARERAASALAYLTNPTAYLESDRGAYLLNTLNMVRSRPLGVGLGDWQTHYPLYRLHQRHRSFSDEVQVRRAHGDHVQFLGELGWPGLSLWAAFLSSLIVRTTRRYLAGRDLPSLCLAAQLVAVTSAMATDYFLEIPFNKFQFFLIVFLVLSEVPESHRRGGSRWKNDGRLALVLAVLVSGAAAVNVYYYVGLARWIHVSARIHEAYLGVMAQQVPAAAGTLLDRAALELVMDLGRRLESLPGYTKTDHKDYLALSQTAFLLGEPRLAIGYARRSLELHPYYPNTMKWMAELLRSRSPEQARAWERAYRYVTDEATTGFLIPYPY